MDPKRSEMAGKLLKLFTPSAVVDLFSVVCLLNLFLNSGNVGIIWGLQAVNEKQGMKM